NDGYLYALDADTGSTQWKVNYHGASNPPSLANGLVYVAGFDLRLKAFDAASGSPVWSTFIGKQIYASAAAGNGMVYVGTYNSGPLSLLRVGWANRRDRLEADVQQRHRLVCRSIE